MSSVLFGLAEMFKDFGLTSALMRKGSVSAAEINFLFWFNVATTVILTVILAGAAPFAGIFFHAPTVTWVILVSLIGFFVGGLTLQHRSLLSRDLKFTHIALIDTASLLAQFLTTLTLAILHFDVWAIVLGSVAGALTGGLLYVLASRWKPARPKLIQEAREILGFGANTSVYAFSLFISTNIASVLIGRVFGPGTLGQYNRANALLALPLQNAVEPMAQASLPVLARLRLQPELYRQAYLTLVTRLNMIVIPSSILLTIGARPLVLTILGAKWELAGRLLEVLGPVVAALGYGYAVGDLFITQNRSRELRFVGMVEMVARLSAISIGLHFGVIYSALGYTVATLAVVSVRVLVAGKSGPVTVWDHCRASFPALPLAAGAASGGFAGIYASHIQQTSPLATTCIILAAGALCSLLAALSVKSSREELITLAVSLRLPGATRWRAHPVQ